MKIDGLVLSLIVGAALLGMIAVVVDRLNFPQAPFNAKQRTPAGSDGATRDRTGAHITDVFIDSGEIDSDEIDSDSDEIDSDSDEIDGGENNDGDEQQEQGD